LPRLGLDGKKLIHLRDDIPAGVHILRPPNFDRLREHLRQRPHFYHLIHFDGHRSVTRGAQGNPPGFTMGAAQGQLIFEDEKGTPQPVMAERLSVLPRKHSIPCMAKTRSILISKG
jgi:hypothetical protein